jgi:hypothetical protein
MTIANSIKAKLDDAKHVMLRQMEEIARLRAENERLRSAAGAHDVLKAIYTDSSQPTTHRLKAAGLALGVETAPLKSLEPPLDLVAEKPEPLADLISRQRARMEAMHAAAQDIEVLANGTVRVLPKPGNGSGDSDH